MKALLTALHASAMLFLSFSLAAANDSVAHIGAGGLELTATDSVVMEKEDLYLSPQRVKVEYIFRNIGTAPIDLRIAFPLPRLDMSLVRGCSDVGIPFRGEENFVHFTTRVNGNPVPMDVQMKAYVGNRDVSDLLRKLDIPFADLSDQLTARLAHLSDVERKTLVEAGALGIEETCHDGPQPLWIVEIVYHWQQRFEPGVATRINHSYSPVVGSFFVPTTEKLSGPADRRSPREPDLSAFCIDESTWQALKRRAPRSGLATGQQLEYILQTARSWSGPIRDFTLTIDKLKPDTIVSLCATGIRKTGPTTFEIRKQDFHPTEDIRLLFVRTDH